MKKKKPREHPVIGILLENITFVEEYHKLVKVFYWDKKIDSPTLEKIQSDSTQVVRICRLYEPDLELGYGAEQLSFTEGLNEHNADAYIERLRKFIWRLKALKDRKVQILKEQYLMKGEPWPYE